MEVTNVLLCYMKITHSKNCRKQIPCISSSNWEIKKYKFLEINQKVI